ncbi:MAG: methylase involved in ubiquinone/menaquinone biosynthesis [uncultured archaeon A07HR60]|jgi:Methylase involved in ubiquinone/menaquinone biosynthesis|nr:MAG: methylase involved in ubiquinone/menaquinone biosynthesis [uncultured archaeon A07HR60]
MSVREEFDAWASSGKDQGMEDRHWHTAKHALKRMPVEQGDTVVDLGTGSGYALRALRDTRDIGPSIGLDGSPAMVANAREYTDDSTISYVSGDFQHLPFQPASVDHAWSMEAFYYAREPVALLREIRRILRPGGTFSCAVNFFEESTHTHEWQDGISIDMTLWTRQQYREAFRSAGLYVAEQDRIPDREIDIPDAAAFPTDRWPSRDAMIDRYRVNGTLLTVGVAP